MGSKKALAIPHGSCPASCGRKLAFTTSSAHSVLQAAIRGYFAIAIHAAAHEHAIRVKLGAALSICTRAGGFVLPPVAALAQHLLPGHKATAKPEQLVSYWRACDLLDCAQDYSHHHLTAVHACCSVCSCKQETHDSMMILHTAVTRENKDASPALSRFRHIALQWCTPAEVDNTTAPPFHSGAVAAGGRKEARPKSACSHICLRHWQAGTGSCTLAALHQSAQEHNRAKTRLQAPTGSVQCRTTCNESQTRAHGFCFLLSHGITGTAVA